VQFVVQRRLRGFIVIADRQMILQVAADRRVIEHDRTPSVDRCAAGPTPDNCSNCSNCGESTLRRTGSLPGSR